MRTRPKEIDADTRKTGNEKAGSKELDPDDIAEILLGRVDECCIS